MKARCLNPTTGWICGTIRSKADGLLSPHMVFSQKAAYKYFMDICGAPVYAARMMQKYEISVPCGHCMACEIRKRRDWTTRLSNEVSSASKCCFITLTYDDDNVPVTCFNPLKAEGKMVDRGVGNLPLQTLLVSDVQKFIKRLRRHLEYIPVSPKKRLGRDHVDTPIRYYICGEYGSKYRRPHYHLLIFGWAPSDMTPWQSRDGHMIYRSAQVEKLWKFGFSTVAPVNGGVAKYCARYVTKKFARLNSSDPFADSVFPEFALQSIRNGGIGAPWFDANLDSVLAKGYVDVRVDGRLYLKQPIPSYYWRRARNKNPCLWLQLRNERILLAKSLPRADVEELLRSVQCYEDRERRLSQNELF